MKKINILIFITFLGFCLSPSEEGIVSISDNTTPTLIISEEDYPKVLTDCLNNEKGYDIITPFDINDLKTTISQLSNSKEEQLRLDEDIDYCISKYNLWVELDSENPEELAKIFDENLDLAKCLREKGLKISDPTQDMPKLDLSALVESKEEIEPLLEECGIYNGKSEKYKPNFNWVFITYTGLFSNRRFNKSSFYSRFDFSNNLSDRHNYSR